MRRSLHVTPKVTLVFILFAFILLFSVGFLAYDSGVNSLETATFFDLTSTAIEKEAAFESWVADGLNDIIDLANSPFMRARVTLNRSTDDPMTRRLTRNQIIAELAPKHGEDDIFTDLILLEPGTGKIIVATDPTEEGTFKENRPYFIYGQNAPYVQNVYFSLRCQCAAMTVSAPIYSNDGELLAVLGGRMNLQQMSSIINRASGEQLTTDAYLVNTSSLLITQPRQITDSAVLQRWNHTESVQQCLSGLSGTSHSEDYRGVPVLSVFRWLSARNLCLVVNIAQTEALQPIQAFGRNLLLIAGIALIGALLLAFALARTITRPVLALRDGVSRFGQGDLQVRLPIATNDEIGSLAREFNLMADAINEKERQLQDYAKDLEARVNQRTAQLSFIANVSRVLSESFDYAERLEQVAQFAVPQIADWCSVDVVDSEGNLRRAAAVHRNPSKIALAFEIQSRYPSRHGSERGTLHVFETGISEFYPDITEAVLVAVTEDAEHLRLMRELGLRSSMIVPLIAHGHALGTLTLVMAESGRTYNEADLALAEDLARRAALLIDNARLYQETQQLNAELEQRVEERTAHLTAVNRELEAFSYSVSHDLRTPLRAVDGFSQALLEDYYDQFDDMGRDFLNRIRTESQRMGRLIDDLIGLSRYTRTEMAVSMIDLSAVGAEIFADLERLSPERSVVYTVQSGMAACGDERLMRVALQNLIGNAWKFTAKKADARIEFGCTHQFGRLEYFVRDNGAGFDMTYANKLFGAFQRLHAMTEYEGTGIGLATVQRIIQRHNGSIRAEGAVDQGAAFYFTLGNNYCDG